MSNFVMLNLASSYIKYFSFGFLLTLLIWFVSVQLGTVDYETLNFQYKTFHFKPFLSLGIAAVINTLPSFLSQLVSMVLVPFAIYVFLINIYKRYIHERWAVLFAILSLSVFEGFPFRDFITLQPIANIKLMQISQFPFPGLSTLLFLVLFYFISRIKVLKESTLFLVTALCACFFYVNALEAVFILGFWFLFFPFRLLKRKNKSLPKVIGITLVQALMVIGIVVYGLVNGGVESAETHNYVQSSYHIIAYYILPIVLMFMLYVIKRIDYYEIWVKFRHIYGFMAIEILIVTLSFTGILPISIDILNSRILQFFIHLFYFVPVVYYLSRPTMEYKKGIEANKAITQLRNILSKSYPKFEQVFTFVISLLLIIYNIYPLILQWTA